MNVAAELDKVIGGLAALDALGPAVAAAILDGASVEPGELARLFRRRGIEVQGPDVRRELERLATAGKVDRIPTGEIVRYRRRAGGGKS